MSDVPTTMSQQADTLQPADTHRLYDPVIILLAGALMTLGVTMVYSATITLEGTATDWRQWWRSPLRQGVFAFLGFLVMLVAAHVDYRVLGWRRRADGWRAGLLLLLTVGLLVAVLVPGVGRSVLGARRAIVIPGLAVGFQPSELAKVTLVIWIAALLTRPTVVPKLGRRSYPLLRPRDAADRRDPLVGATRMTAYTRGDIRDFQSGFLPLILSAGVVIALIGVEDFGTAALMGVIMLAMLLVGRARWSHLTFTTLLAFAGGVALILVKEHRVGRIQTWLSGEADPSGAGYQIRQALLAIGSGGWFGQGLGAGVQKYGYLPQDNNDFIFAIICEELGVVGGLVVVGLFLALLVRGWQIAERAPDRFGRLLAMGITLTLCLQAAFNIGVVTNSVPTKGISLPFVSAGGSGVVVLGLAAGLLSAIGRSHPPKAEP